MSMYVFLRRECSECRVLRTIEFGRQDNVWPVDLFRPSLTA